MASVAKAEEFVAGPPGGVLVVAGLTAAAFLASSAPAPQHVLNPLYAGNGVAAPQAPQMAAPQQMALVAGAAGAAEAEAEARAAAEAAALTARDAHGSAPPPSSGSGV